MKQLLVLLICACVSVHAQDEIDQSLIKQMSWGVDYKIKLTLKNDSVYFYDVENLHHSDVSRSSTFSGFTYLPATMSDDFIAKLKTRGIELGIDSSLLDSTAIMNASGDKTLWSALHSLIGGGWVHFVNTLLYALEKGYLNLSSPILLRPVSSWRPSPVTESYRRTHKWKYYVPMTQKEAIKEYKIKQERGELGDLANMPDKFIQSFLSTNDKKYHQLQKSNNRKAIARIDLIRLLLGSNYLGTKQIAYIKYNVMRAVNQYSQYRLPSVIIFDNFRAAVAMSLNENGYVIDKIIFKDQDEAPVDELELRRHAIHNLIKNINEVNMEIFRERLKNYYRS